MLVNGGCTDVEIDGNALTRTISMDSSHKGLMIDPTSPSSQMLINKKNYVSKFADDKTEPETMIGSTDTLKYQDSVHNHKPTNIISFEE
jgi:hypothetical protein